MSKQEEKEDGNDGTGLKGWNMTEGMEQDWRDGTGFRGGRRSQFHQPMKQD